MKIIIGALVVIALFSFGFKALVTLFATVGIVATLQYLGIP